MRVIITALSSIPTVIGAIIMLALLAGSVVRFLDKGYNAAARIAYVLGAICCAAYCMLLVMFLIGFWGIS